MCKPYLIALPMLLLGFSTQAKIQMSVSPAKIVAVIPPGQSATQVVTVTNSAGAGMYVKVYAWDWGNDEKNKRIFAPPGTLESSAATWIISQPRELYVPAQGSAQARMTIVVPQDAAGGHYAAAFFQIAKPDRIAKDGKKSLNLAARIGVLVMVEVAQRSNPAVEVDDLVIDPPGPASPMVMRVNLRNTGDVHVFPEAKVLLLSANKEMVGSFESGKQLQILPGSFREFSVEWGGELAPGEYDAVITLVYAPQKNIVLERRFQVDEVNPIGMKR